MPRPVTDHSIILLETVGMLRGKGGFKFENMRLKVDGLVDKSQNWCISQKIKAFKEGVWNKQ
jgi:hypothetical protein